MKRPLLGFMLFFLVSIASLAQSSSDVRQDANENEFHIDTAMVVRMRYVANTVGHTMIDFADSIAELHGGKVTPINYKSFKSTLRKCNQEKVQANEINDLVRCTIACPYDSLHSMITDLVQTAKKKGMFKKYKHQSYLDRGYWGDMIILNHGMVHEPILLPHVHEELVRIPRKDGIWHPIDHLVIALHAVVQKEEVHVSLEGSEEIEEFLILFYAPPYGAVLPVVVIFDALEGQIPSVLYVPVESPHLIDAVPVAGEDDGSADGVGFFEMCFDVLVPSVDAQGFCCLLYDVWALFPAAEGCRDGVVGEEDAGIPGDDHSAGIVLG